MKTIKILIADDHPIFLIGLEQLIKEKYPNFDVIKSNDGLDAWNKIGQFLPNIVISDINMPHINGLKLCQKIKSKYSDITVVLLTMYKEPGVLEKAIHYGADGYILKDHSYIEIISILNDINKDGIINPKRIELLQNRIIDDLKSSSLITNKLLNLTETEKKIVYFVSKSMPTADIAKKLFLSPKTVENYRSKICHKLQLTRKNNSLLSWAIENADIIEDMNCDNII